MMKRIGVNRKRKRQVRKYNAWPSVAAGLYGFWPYLSSPAQQSSNDALAHFQRARQLMSAGDLEQADRNTKWG